MVDNEKFSAFDLKNIILRQKKTLHGGNDSSQVQIAFNEK